MPVAVVTDSTHYLPAQVVEERGLHVVSLHVNRGGVSEPESGLTDLGAFYARLAEEADLPTTSQPAAGAFVDTYEALARAGNDVVSIHLSGALSGTVESARQAAEIARESTGARIEVVDSRAACGALGLTLLAATGAAAAGEDVDGVLDRARRGMEGQKFWFAVDTLEYLRRGGRIGRAQAMLGGALKVKPILDLADGQISPVERVRTSRRAFERMTTFLQELHDADNDGWAVQHIRAPEEQQRLVDRGREIFGTEPLLLGEIGPVIGSHVGPGLLGVGAMPRALAD